MSKFSKAKKIIFPFFNANRHEFLTEKWWFRLLTVTYLIGVVVLLYKLLEAGSQQEWGWCYDSAHLYIDNAGGFAKRLDECGKMLNEARKIVWAWSFVATLVVHYLVQFIFYKIVINFIVLGGKKATSKNEGRIDI